MPHLVFSELRASGLPQMDWQINGGLADPYLRFLSHPPDLLRARRARDVTTRVQRRTRAPDWGDQSYMVRARAASPAELAGAHLIIAVMDCGELGRRDEVIGSVAFSLSEVHARTHGVGASSVPAASFAFVDEPITHCGRLRGHLSGSITLLWPSDTQFPHGTKTKHLYENRRPYVRRGCF